MDQQTHQGSARGEEREEETERLYAKIIKNVSNLTKDKNINSQEAQRSPSRVNSLTYSETH